MKYDDNTHGGPSIVISLALGPPNGKKGKKGKEEGNARKAIAKQKVGLKKMYDTWSRKTGAAGQYRDELGAFIEGMEE
jgi:hypothetical protein